MAIRSRSKQHIPLLIESYPVDYTGYRFITLLQFNTKHVLAIIDNVCDDSVKALVLDSCSSQNVDQGVVLQIAEQWYLHNKDNYPITIEFSKNDLSGYISPIIQTYNKEFITRVIGPFPSFNMTVPHSIKRRRRKAISKSVKIIPNNVVNFKNRKND